MHINLILLLSYRNRWWCFKHCKLSQPVDGCKNNEKLNDHRMINDVATERLISRSDSDNFQKPNMDHIGITHRNYKCSNQEPQCIFSNQYFCSSGI